MGVVWAALWLGVLAGLGGFVARVVYPPPMREPLWGPWLSAPLIEVLLFAIAGAAVRLATWAQATRRWRTPAVFVLAALAVLGPLLQVPWLHRYAALLVAAGVSAQFLAVLRMRPRFAGRLMATSGAVLLPAVLGLALVPPVLRGFNERRAASSSPRSAEKRPNVLLVTLCSVRAQSMSSYGHSRPTTPHFTRLAEQGVLFEGALSTAPWTFPAHASMLTGRLPEELSADYFVPLDAAAASLPEVLQARGYATAGFVANYLYCGVATRLDRGFAHYNDRPRWTREGLRMSALGQIITTFDVPKQLVGGFDDVMPCKAGITRKSAAQVNREFLDWHAAHSAGPFFAFLNYYDAHEPYVPPPPFSEKFRDTPAPRRQATSAESFGGMPWRPLTAWHKELDQRLLRYEQCIAYLDEQLGRLLAELERRGVLEDTLVIVAGDHGEQFGEHGLEGHGNSLYRQLIQVPLLVSWPGRVPEGVRVRAAVSLRDIPATVLAALELRGAAAMPGESLLRFVDADRSGEAAADEPVFSSNNLTVATLPAHRASKGSQQSVVAAGMHYIVDHGRGTQELYDFQNDPLEQRNLIETQGAREQLGELRSILEIGERGRGGSREATDARAAVLSGRDGEWVTRHLTGLSASRVALQ